VKYATSPPPFRFKNQVMGTFSLVKASIKLKSSKDGSSNMGNRSQ
jgi:hypothetical protein